jgi:hypothetical protein
MILFIAQTVDIYTRQSYQIQEALSMDMDVMLQTYWHKYHSELVSNMSSRQGRRGNTRHEANMWSSIIIVVDEEHWDQVTEQKIEELNISRGWTHALSAGHHGIPHASWRRVSRKHDSGHDVRLST